MTPKFEKIIELLVEQELSKLHPCNKGQVVDLDTSSKLANNISKDISNLVKTTYGSIGGFPGADNPKDVLKRFTNFLTTDIDEDPEPDSAILYTNWGGSKKASALVSDGSPEARKKLKSMMYSFFNEPGAWIEVSGAPANILIKKMGFSSVDNEDEVRKTLSNIKDIEWHGEHPSGVPYGKGWYSRNIGGRRETKIIVGNVPKINKKINEDAQDELRGPLYHVTYARNLGSIAEYGLTAGSTGKNFGKGYASHSSKGLFLTEKSGIDYWYSKLEDMAEHSSDNFYEDELVPVVLKIDPEGYLEDHLDDDELGSTDALHDAFIARDDIPPEYIEIWDGSSWISIDDWDEVDIEQALEHEEIEDDDYDGEEEVYYLFKSNNPLIP